MRGLFRAATRQASPAKPADRQQANRAPPDAAREHIPQIAGTNDDTVSMVEDMIGSLASQPLRRFLRARAR
jgi:hypothetical protein